MTTTTEAATGREFTERESLGDDRLAEVVRVIATDYGRRIITTLLPVVGYDGNGEALVPGEYGLLVQARTVPGFHRIIGDSSGASGCLEFEECDCLAHEEFRLCESCETCQRWHEDQRPCGWNDWYRCAWCDSHRIKGGERR